MACWRCSNDIFILDLTPGARPTNDILIKFEICPKFGVLLFKIYLTDHNQILYMSRQWHCRGMCKILLWSVECILNQSTAYFGRISNSIEISLVGRAPGFNGLGKYNCKVRQETFKFWDLDRLILDIWQ